MLFPTVDCTPNHELCLLTVGEGEINAAASMTALAFSPLFALRKTYFMFTGIAGVNPRKATLGSVALARYSVQVALQYEIDTRSLPADWETGYFAYGCSRPNEYPTITYGTEVFELNAALRDKAYLLSSNATLSDSEGPRKYRARYGPPIRPAPPKRYKRPLRDEDDEIEVNEYHAASGTPSVVRCDTATSDVYYSGTRLSEAFERTTALWTNGTGEYCMTAQEDNANLEVMVRADIEGMVDFSRILVMRSGKFVKCGSATQCSMLTRTGSNFDRPPPGLTDLEHLTRTDQNGFTISIDNLFNAGLPIVRGILDKWDCTYKQGIPAENYIGDIFGSLGGDPDFGLGSITGGERVKPMGCDGGSDGGDEHAKRMALRRARRWRGARLLGKL
jgi:purine nucleoside permease